MRAAEKRWLAVLAAAAALNLTAGMWLSTRPLRSFDLQQVATWSGEWVAGLNPFGDPARGVDYPPWALVALAPLSSVAQESLPILWAVVNLGLLMWLTTTLARQTREPPNARLALVLLFAATSPARALNQFSVLSDALAVAGALWPGRRVGPVLLGLSLMKPQVGGVVLVWLLLRRQWKRAAMALSIPLALTIVFAVRLGMSPTGVLRQYRDAVTFVHNAPDVITGHTELIPWLARALPLSGTAGLTVVALLGVLLILPAIVAGIRRRPRDDDGWDLLALCGAASLLAMRHLSYDFILLWPALVAWRVWPCAVWSRQAGWRVGFVGLAGLLVLGLPAWVRLAVELGAPAGLLVATEADRLLTVLVWGVLAWRVTTAGRR